jgi:hypothetical protein
MDYLMLIFLFLVSLLLTLAINLGLRNRGPWGNPMLFFVVLFMTSWTVLLWTRPVAIDSINYPYISVAMLALLIAILLAATRTPTWGRESVRVLDKNKVVDVVTGPGRRSVRKLPGTWFWILLVMETLLILFAYILKFY